MSIEAITGVGASSVLSTERLQSSAPAVTSGVTFDNWLTQQLDAVNDRIGTAEHSLVQLASGEGNLHDVMIQLEQARTAFQLTLQVRNKLLESYQELMRMQL